MIIIALYLVPVVPSLCLSQFLYPLKVPASPEEQGVDAVSHVVAVWLQDLYQGGGGGEGQGLGGPGVRHPETQAQTAHHDTLYLHSTETCLSLELNFWSCYSFCLLSFLCQMSKQKCMQQKTHSLNDLAAAQKATGVVLNFGIVVFT